MDNFKLLLYMSVMSAASGDGGVAASKKAVPPVPVRQSSVSDTASNACIVSKKLNVQLFKGDLCCCKISFRNVLP